jgi:hypothetical protein
VGVSGGYSTTMTTVVNGRDAALWSADAVPDAAAGPPAEPASHAARTGVHRAGERAGAHRAGDLVWARICWGVTIAGMTGALLVLAAIAYHSVT